MPALLTTEFRDCRTPRPANSLENTYLRFPLGAVATHVESNFVSIALIPRGLRSHAETSYWPFVQGACRDEQQQTVR